MKILEIDREKIEEKLREMGAKKIFEGKLYGIMFDFPDNSLAKSGKMLRLRKEGEKSFLTFKILVSREGAKQAKEIQNEVKDFEGARKVLKDLGLVEFLVIKKTRISYSLGKTHFDIDKLEGEFSRIPEYMEIEGESKEAIFEAAQALGFSRDDCKPWDAKGVLNFYGMDIPGLVI